MNRFVLNLAYNGTRYHGWQIQNNAPTVQSEINRAINLIFQSEIQTIGCGRTDTGVHARDFYMHFDYEGELPSNFTIRINKLLSADISVFDVYRAPNNFNARFDALNRQYEYVISKVPNPFEQHLYWLMKRPLDLSIMNKACEILMNHTDFESFSKIHTEVNNFKCTIYEATWEQKGEKIFFRITANRFLRNMVRAIVGTLINVGLNKIDLIEFENIIKAKKRSEAGESVPACGLFLNKVNYDMSALEKL